MQKRAAASNATNARQETGDSKIRRKASMLTLQYRTNPPSEHVSRERDTRGTQPANVANAKKQRSMPGLRSSSKNVPSVPAVPTSSATPEVPPRKSSYRWFPRSEPKASAKRTAKAQEATPTPPSRGENVLTIPHYAQRASTIDNRLRKQKSMPGLRPSVVTEAPLVPCRPRATSSVYSRSSSRSSVFIESVEDAPERVPSRPVPRQESIERFKQQRPESRSKSSRNTAAPGSGSRAKDAPASKEQPPRIPPKAASRRHDSGNVTWRPGHYSTVSEVKIPAEVANTKTKQLRSSKSMPKLWLAKESVSKIPRLNDLLKKPSIDALSATSTAANPRGINHTLRNKDSRLELNRKRSIYFDGTAHRAEATMEIVDLYLEDEDEAWEVSPEKQRSMRSEDRKPRPSKREPLARENDWKIPNKGSRAPEWKDSQRMDKPLEAELEPILKTHPRREEDKPQPVQRTLIPGPVVAPFEQLAAGIRSPKSLRKTESSSRLWSSYRFGANLSAPSTPASKTLKRQASTPIIRLYRSADAPPVKERIAHWEESLLLPVLPTIRYPRRDVATPTKGLGINLDGSPKCGAAGDEAVTPSSFMSVERGEFDTMGFVEDPESPSAGRGLLVDSPRNSEESAASRSPDWPLRAA